MEQLCWVFGSVVIGDARKVASGCLLKQVMSDISPSNLCIDYPLTVNSDPAQKLGLVFGSANILIPG